MSTDTLTPAPSFLRAMVASLARHALTGLAGALVAKGALSQTQSAELVDVGAALAIYGLTLWWSYAQKKHSLPQPAAADEPPT